MATIIKKKKKGHYYYYAVQSERIDGKPRITWQKYLGTVENIVRNLEACQPPPPKETILWEFGGVAALLGITQQLGLIELIDRHIPKRHQGPTVGHYLVLAALNRALAPCSKLQIGKWYDQTLLRRLWKFKPSDFSSQHFWDHMSLCEEQALERIEVDLVKKIIDIFQVEPGCLLYDTTNFFTFVDTYNSRTTLPQRGHSKAKRHDLRQVGLALVVSKIFGVPLFHQVYAGNSSDQKVFGGVILELARRHQQLAEQLDDITLVFDKGCSSFDNLEALSEHDLHFVAALGISSAGELLEVPLEKYHDTGLPGVRSYRATGEFFGQERQVIVSYSESFFAQQLASVTQRMVSCQRQLQNLSRNLEKWSEGKLHGRKPTLDSVKKQLKEILRHQFMKDIFTIELDESALLLNCRLNNDYLRWLTEHRLGKTVLITDQKSWSDTEIIKAYRGLSNVEKAFKHLKNTDFLHWQPSYHWTDQKLKVHGFYCVLGLTLAAIARKLLVEAGLEISLEKMLSELQEIKEVAVIYPKGTLAHRKDHMTVSKMSPSQKKIADVLNIAQFQIPKEG